MRQRVELFSLPRAHVCGLTDVRTFHDHMRKMFRSMRFQRIVSCKRFATVRKCTGEKLIRPQMNRSNVTIQIRLSIKRIFTSLVTKTNGVDSLPAVERVLPDKYKQNAFHPNALTCVSCTTNVWEILRGKSDRYLLKWAEISISLGQPLAKLISLEL